MALELPLAGPSSRILAFGIDYAFVLLIQLAIWGVGLLSMLSLFEAEQWLEPWAERLLDADGDLDLPLLVGLVFAGVILVDLVVQIVYFVGFESLNQGRSPGKAAVGLQVVRDGGLPMTWRDALVRNLLRAVDVLPTSYFVGFVAMLLSAEGKRLGDHAAGTLVVRHDRPAPAPPVAEAESEEPADGLARRDPDTAAFRFERAQVDRLAAPELRLLRQTLRRVDDLPPHVAAVALARSVDALARRIGHDPVPAERARAFLRALLRAAEGA